MKKIQLLLLILMISIGMYSSANAADSNIKKTYGEMTLEEISNFLDTIYQLDIERDNQEGDNAILEQCITNVFLRKLNCESVCDMNYDKETDAASYSECMDICEDTARDEHKCCYDNHAGRPCN